MKNAIPTFTKLFLAIFLFVIFSSAVSSQTSERPRYGPRSERNNTDELKRRQGTWKFYYPNGEIRSEVTYSNNFLQGPYKNYYFGEKIMEECNYFGGKKDGDFKKYFLSGQAAIEGKYNFGKKDEKWIFYYEEGQIKKECEYKNGLPDGQWKVYDKKGKLLSEITYKNGINMSAPPPAPKVPKAVGNKKEAPKAKK